MTDTETKKEKENEKETTDCGCGCTIDSETATAGTEITPGEPFNARDPMDPLGCIPQDVNHAVLPCGTIKFPGQERLYITTTSQRLTRSAYKNWSEKVSCRLDPVVWYKGMGHRPIPDDVRAQLTGEELEVLDRVEGLYDDTPIAIGGSKRKPRKPTVHLGSR